MRHLIVVRHAKADPEDRAGDRDIDRSLTERGHRDAAATGSALRALTPPPSLALVSAARRTRETWTDLARTSGWDVDAIPDEGPDEGLYVAGPDTVLDLLRSSGDHPCVVVVGHNPTMSYVATTLDDGSGDADAAGRMASGFPTSAAAVFAHDRAWSDLDAGTAQLIGYVVGRG